MRALGFGTYDRAKHPRAGIILDGLRAHGDEIVECNAPLGFSTAERVAMLGRPWLVYRLALRILERWGRLAGRSRGRGRGRFDAVIVGYLGHFDVMLARALYPRGRIVLDQLVFAADTARDRGVRSGLKLRLLDALDRIAVRCADLVVLDTDEQVALLAAPAQSKAVVVPVGADQAWFDAAAARPVAGDPVRVVFFGLYTPLQGAVVIGRALAQLADRPDIAVTMIGSGQDHAATREQAAANRHVTWVDWVEADDLPALVAAHDICLGIFGSTPKALRVVPNKVYQGAAAGCVVLTSATPPQQRALAPGALGDCAVFVAPDDADGLAAALRALADDPARMARLRTAARALALARFTAAEVVEPLRTRLLAAGPAASVT